MIDNGAAGCWAATNDRKMACDAAYSARQFIGCDCAACQSRPDGGLGVRVTSRECVNHLAGALLPAEPICCEDLC